MTSLQVVKKVFMKQVVNNCRYLKYIKCVWSAGKKSDFHEKSPGGREIQVCEAHHGFCWRV